MSGSLMFGEWIASFLALCGIFTMIVRRDRQRSKLVLDQVKLELSESRQQFQDLFENIDGAIWSLETQSNGINVSAGVEKVYGYSRKEFQLNPELWLDVVYPEDMGIVEKFDRILKSGESANYEHRIIHKNGTVRWLQCVGTPVADSENRVVRINGIVIDITEKKAVQEELDRNRLMLQNILNTVDVAIWSYDHSARKTQFTSGAFMKITGYPPEHFLLSTNWEKIIHPDDLPLYQKIAGNVLQGNDDNSEYRIIHANGEIRWVQGRIIPTIGELDSVSRLEGVVIDVTAAKAMEEALSRSEQHHKSLFEHNSDLICEFDLDGKLLNVNQTGRSFSGTPFSIDDWDDSWSNLLDDEMIRIASAHFRKAKQGEPQRYEIQILLNGEHWDIKQVPIFVNSEIVGIFSIGRDISQKKAIEQALSDSESKYRFIADNMTDLLEVLDTDGTIRFASPSLLRVFGVAEEQMTGTCLFDYIHPADQAAVREEFMGMVRAQTNRNMRFRIIDPKGQVMYTDCLATPVLGEDGTVDTVIAVSRDITEQVRVENELKESEERYRRLLELNPKPMASYRDGTFIYINKAGVRLLGAETDEDIIGRSIYDIVHPEYMEISKQRVKFVSEEKFADSLEYRLIRLDGKEISAELSGIHDDQSRSTLIMFNDVTEQKQMEKALRESEERYRKLVELSPLAIAVYQNGQFTYFNPAGMRLVGADCPEEILGSHPLTLVHPEDLAYAKGRMADTEQNGYGGTGEFRIIRLDGKTVELLVTSIYDAESSAVQLVFEDITSRKNAERDLLESEELNRQLVELSPQAIAFHCDFKYNYVNPAGVAFFGASHEDELLGKNLLDFTHPDYKDETEQRLTRVYNRQGRPAFVEQKLLRLDGTAINAEIIVGAVPYKGQNAGITLLRDITDRKKAEEEREHAESTVRESEDRYFHLQMSLDSFSNDLFGVMKASDMELRLVKEVRDVFLTSVVSLIEVDYNRNAVAKSGSGSIPAGVLEELLTFDLKYLPVCEIIDMATGCFLKLAEMRGKNILICIGEQVPDLTLTPKRVWLKTIARYVNVLYDSFRLIEDLTSELEQIANHQVAPSWLLRVLFNLSENERKRLSQDLHDAALQEQIIWYRKLEQLASDTVVPFSIREQLQPITQGLLDVVYQIRITCNELRPPMLREEGLVSSFEALFELTQMRTNYSIEFDSTRFRHVVTDEQLIGLYRIVQELLANATKHSNATKVAITLTSRADGIRLTYEDNGVGMDLNDMDNSLTSMGVYGMKERVRSLDGKIEFQSSLGNGLAVFITVPDV